MKATHVLLISAIVLLLLSTSGCTPQNLSTSVVRGELDWWPTKALPEPYPDPNPARHGQWWWPTEQVDEPDPVWGNRGFVYVLRYGEEEVVIGAAREPIVLPRGLKEVEALVLEDVVFDFDKSTLKPEAQQHLLRVVEILNTYPAATVTLEGHTCSIGTEQYNLGLGQRRANSVRDFLLEHAIAPERLKAISYGETRLKYPEGSRIDYQRNRRVEFRVELPKPEGQ